ncbi:DUF6059 family protein [Streptomyces sp. NPDC002838]|uniref:DUF6059 family protein n=1 Tax=Streptomyces sp. NPDC002838 TaxID=3154436 RepID=UPI00332EDDE3
MGALAIGMPPPPEFFAHHPRQGNEPAEDHTAEAGSPHSADEDATGGPVPGHPERLIPHIPPAPDERALWSQLR